MKNEEMTIVDGVAYHQVERWKLQEWRVELKGAIWSAEREEMIRRIRGVLSEIRGVLAQ